MKHPIPWLLLVLSWVLFYKLAAPVFDHSRGINMSEVIAAGMTGAAAWLLGTAFEALIQRRPPTRGPT